MRRSLRAEVRRPLGAVGLRLKTPPAPRCRRVSSRDRAGRGFSSGRRADSRRSRRREQPGRLVVPGAARPRGRRVPEPSAVPAALTFRQRPPPLPPWPPCCVSAGMCLLAGWQADWAVRAAAALKAAAARACAARPLARPRGATARLRVPGHPHSPTPHPQPRMRHPAGRAPGWAVGGGRTGGPERLLGLTWQSDEATNFGNDCSNASSAGIDCQVLGTRQAPALPLRPCPGSAGGMLMLQWRMEVA